MKSHSCSALLFVGTAFFCAPFTPSLSAATLLDDDFGNSDLAINMGIGGGFATQGNGANNPGSVTETATEAQITDGDGNNTFGIRSVNAFDLSDSGLTYTATWTVSKWDIGSSGGTERIFLTLQTNDSWLFSGDAEESRLIVEINAGNNNAYLRYQNRSSGSNTNYDSASVSLGSLTGDVDGFTGTLVADSTGYSFTTTGLDATQQVSISGTWASLGVSFNQVMGTDGEMHLATYIQDTNTTGAKLDLARVSLVTGTPPNLPVISSFSANPPSAVAGSTVQLSWQASSYDTLTLNPGGIDAAALTSGGTGSTNVTVSGTTAYTLSATLGGETTQSQLTVTERVIPNRPNILLVLIDDMGITDTSVPFIYNGAGNPETYQFNNFYVTPNMETLAANGMKFTQAYATPACTSSRVSLMTGFNTMRHGVVMQVNPFGVISPNAVSPFTSSHDTPNSWKSTGMQAVDTATSMPKVLSDAGYRTIHCGKAHFGSSGSYAANPLSLGFDINLAGSHLGTPPSYTGSYGGNLPGMDPWENTGTFLTNALTQALNGAIEDAVNDGVPFFAYMSHYGVHTPFTTDPDATGNYSSAVNGSHKKFATMVEGMDHSLGGLLNKLDQLGIAENTLVIFLGDNGSDSPAATQAGLASGAFSDFPLRGKKGTEWEGGIRVPMLVSWAKVDAANTFQTALPITSGSREDDIVTVWDVFPTVFSVTGTAPPHDVDGYDLSNYLRGVTGNHRPQEMLVYWPNDHNGDFFAVFRDANWKLIYRFSSDSFELYDLDSDPTESNDVSSSHAERVMEMARKTAQGFNDGWGQSGTLWPTLDGSPSSRPYNDDPFAMPSLPAVDTDQDGIPDNTEDLNNNGLVDTGETDPVDQDSDNDSSPDGVEVRTGTDPLNGNNFFRIDLVGVSGTQVQVTWPSAPGASYRIESSTELSTWNTVLDQIPASGVGNSTSKTVTVPANTPKWFLRSVLLPE